MKSIVSTLALFSALALTTSTASADVIAADLDLSTVSTQRLINSIGVADNLNDTNLQLVGNCYRGSRGYRGGGYYYAPRPVYRSYYRGGGFGYGGGYGYGGFGRPYGGFPGRGFGGGLYIGF